MIRVPNSSWLVLALCLLVTACATRPINPRITHTDMASGYRYVTRPDFLEKDENLVILAFSGGGTRAAAFSYGALEFLRNTVITGPDGNRSRLLDHVGVITGVSGGSFTALAYGLYGDRLFDEYEQRFLKRDVQGAIVGRVFNPAYWPSLWSTGWGRSELAADLYDEILFNGATFGDLNRGRGPMIIASATDITTGARLPFTQTTFDVLCADLSAVRLSRAAAASSAVPVLLSPITINNYGGTCNYVPPSWIQPFVGAADPPRPAARAIRHIKEEAEFADGANRPYIHLVDGGVADNVGMRSVLDVLELMDALQSVGLTTPLDHIRKVVVFVVNSLSIPKVTWDKTEEAPGTLQIMVKAAGVPIDHYSYESTELLRDTQAKWKAMARIRGSQAFAAENDQVVKTALHTPNATIYAIDVSFSQLKDKDERAYLNELPTSFHLAPEEVDRLRAAAGKIILESPDFHRLIDDLGGRIELAPSDNAQKPAGAGSPGTGVPE